MISITEKNLVLNHTLLGTNWSENPLDIICTAHTNERDQTVEVVILSFLNRKNCEYSIEIQLYHQNIID